VLVVLAAIIVEELVDRGTSMDELGKKGSMPIPASSSNGMLRGYLSRPPKKIYSSQFFFFKISLCV